MKRRTLFIVVPLIAAVALGVSMVEMFKYCNSMATEIDDIKVEVEKDRGFAETAVLLAKSSVEQIAEEIVAQMQTDADNNSSFQSSYDASYSAYDSQCKATESIAEQNPPIEFTPDDYGDIEEALKLTVAPLQQESGFVTIKEIYEKYPFLDARDAWNGEGKQRACDHTCSDWSSGSVYNFRCDNHVDMWGMMVPQVRHMAILINRARKQGLFNRDPSKIPQ